MWVTGYFSFFSNKTKGGFPKQRTICGLEMSKVHGQTTGHHGQTVKQSCPQTVTTNLTDKRAQMGKNQNETNMSSNEEVEKGGNVEEDVSEQYNLF